MHLPSRPIPISSLIGCSLLMLTHLLAQPNAVQLVGQLDPRGDGIPGNQDYAACWGWTSEEGHEYALMGACVGTSIIDLESEPISEVAFIPGPPFQSGGPCWREIKTHKQFAYVVSEHGAGVQIIDLSGLPREARLVREFIFTDPITMFNTLTSHTVTIADGFLYLNGSSNWPPGGTLIFSLREDPTNPRFAGMIQPTYIHDSYVLNDRLYGAAIGPGGGVYVFDVRDKSNPVEIARITYPNSTTHNTWVSVDERFLFTTDEDPTGEHNAKVWDISRLPSFSRVAEYSANPRSVTHNVHGRGNFLYVAHYAEGMRVVDIHDPRNPVEVGWYDTYPEEDTTRVFVGCWEVYPYFPSGRWIGSDMQTGLYVCTFDGLIPRRRVSLVGPPDGDTLRPGDQLRWTSAADQTEDPHFYDLRIRGSLLDTTISISDTTYQFPAGFPLRAGERYSWHVIVRDEYSEVKVGDTLHFISAGVQAFSFRLDQNYPNPFSGRTSIMFTLEERTRVTLRVYNLLGQQMRSLLEDVDLNAGVHQMTFFAIDPYQGGSQQVDLPPGLYLYRLTTPRFSETRKMTLFR